jgi:hypothetical protein
MPSETMSGALTVVLTDPMVAGMRVVGTDVVSVASNFWSTPERHPMPIVVVGVGVRVAPAVNP